MADTVKAMHRRAVERSRWRFSPAVLAVVAVTLPIGSDMETAATAGSGSEVVLRSADRVEAAVRAVTEAVRQLCAPQAVLTPPPTGAPRVASVHDQVPTAAPGASLTPLCLSRPSLIDLPPPRA